MSILHSLSLTTIKEFDGDYPDFVDYCNVCGEAIRGPYYSGLYLGNTFILHKSCAEIPGEIQHPLHPEHPLRIRYRLDRAHDFICDGCQTFSPTLKYRCKKCNVHFDYQCISKHVEGQALKERVYKVTDNHRHRLQLLYFPHGISLICRCCLKGFEDSAYVCLKCEFFTHESCLDTIPKQVKSSFHPQHSLLPRCVRSPASGICDACGRELRGIELRCQLCDSSFHVSCGKSTTPGLRLQDHEHKLYYLDCGDVSIYDPFIDWDVPSDCDICDEICRGPIYRCIQRGINFHVECLVPPVLNHECHDHQLTLTSSVVPRGNASKYRCDVCEEEEDFKHYVYHCEECYYMAHIECLFSEEDNLPLVDSEQQIDEVQEAEESDVKGEESETSSDEETDESEIVEEEENLENYSLSELKKKIKYLTIKLDLFKEKYDQKLSYQF